VSCNPWPSVSSKAPGLLKIRLVNVHLDFFQLFSSENVYSQDWALVKAFPDLPKKGVLSLAWGPKAGSILVGGGDHNLRVFGLTGGDAEMQE
jgi:hypothetical protein